MKLLDILYRRCETFLHLSQLDLLLQRFLNDDGNTDRKRNVHARAFVTLKQIYVCIISLQCNIGTLNQILLAHIHMLYFGGIGFWRHWCVSLTASILCVL